MAPSFLQLLRRDHDDVEAGLRALVRPRTCDLRNVIDGVRLGMLAHAEAEDIVLDIMLGATHSEALHHAMAEARMEHREQERALGALMRTVPGTSLWRDRALHLLALVRHHKLTQEPTLRTALERDAPAEVVARLAGAFATERLRQLAMFAPSAPIAVPDEVCELMYATA
jgi:hypothetical protein|nr:hypothetical protein [Kofleriaceae bacterium]